MAAKKFSPLLVQHALVEGSSRSFLLYLSPQCMESIEDVGEDDTVELSEQVRLLSLSCDSNGVFSLAKWMKSTPDQS